VTFAFCVTHGFRETDEVPVLFGSRFGERYADGEASSEVRRSRGADASGVSVGRCSRPAGVVAAAKTRPVLRRDATRRRRRDGRARRRRRARLPGHRHPDPDRSLATPRSTHHTGTGLL